MTPVEVYRAEAWFEMLAHKERRLGARPAVIVIPDEAAKETAAAIFPELENSAIYTIPDLVGRYVKKKGKAGLISRHALEAVLSTIVSESSTAYLNIEKYRQGYIKALTGFFYKFRSSTLVGLREAISTLKSGRLTAREKELVRLDAACRKKLGQLGFDLRSGLEGLLDQSKAAGFDFYGNLCLPEGRTLIFWGFDTLTPLESRFVELAFEKGSRAVFLHCADGQASEQALRVQQSVAALLKQSGMPPQVDLLPAAPDRKNYYTALACSLFRPSAEKPPLCDPGGAAGWDRANRPVVLKANDRFAEITAVARRIKKLAGEGVPLDSIRIVAPAYDLYAAIIRELFPGYGIPFILEEGSPLLEHPLAALINNLVVHSAGVNPFALREKIFSSPYVSYESEVTAADLLEYQAAAGVELLAPADLRVQLASGGLFRLDYQAINRQQRAAYRFVQPAPGIHPLALLKRYFDEAGAGAERPVDRFQALLQSYLLNRAGRDLSPWRPRMSASEFRETLQMLLRRFRIAAACFGAATAASDSPQGRSIEGREKRVIRQIELILDEFEAVQAPLELSAEAPFPLADLARIFTRLMLEARLSTPSGAEGAACPGGAAVSVQSVERSQYRRWDYTFICGLVDGEFPPVEEFNFLQPRKDGLGLGCVYTGVDLARNRFYQLIRTTTEGLYLSCPRSYNGRRLPPSPLLKEAEKLLPRPAAGTVTDAPGQAQATGGAPLYSRREKLPAIAENVDRDFALVGPLLKELRREDEAFFDHVAAVMRFDGLAACATGLSEFDGLFDPGGPAIPLLESALQGINFTPEVLERYAACPLRFFFDDILGLKREQDYHPDSAGGGAAIGAILKEYTAAICAAEKTLEDDDAAAALLSGLAARYFETRKSADPIDVFQARFQKQLTAGFAGDGEGRPGLFYAFLQYEAAGPDLLKPCRANLAGEVELDEDLKVSVEIDRVDFASWSNCCFLYRYTTAPGDPRRIARGLRFDLPLMLMLFADCAAAGEKPEAAAAGPVTGPAPAAGAGLYLVKSPQQLKRHSYMAIDRLVASRRHLVSEERPVFSGQRSGLIAQEHFAGALESIANHLCRLRRLMERGVFHPPLCEEREQSCANCTFERLCRKDQARLDSLSLALQGTAEINTIKELF